MRKQPHRYHIAAAIAHLVDVGKARSPAPGEASLASVEGATQPLMLFDDDDANLDPEYTFRTWAVFPSRPRTSNHAPLAHGLNEAPVIMFSQAVVGDAIKKRRLQRGFAIHRSTKKDLPFDFLSTPPSARFAPSPNGYQRRVATPERGKITPFGNARGTDDLAVLARPHS